MKAYNIIKYSNKYYDDWNDFVSNSKNATFLFHRDFMDYHKDRFEDFSLLVYKQKKLIALLPANIEGIKLYSHQGLSYGGLLLPYKISFEDVLFGFYELLKFLDTYKLEHLVIKQTPRIYYRQPSDELDYLLFILHAELYRRDLSMVIPVRNEMSFSTLRKRQLKLAKMNDLKLIEEHDFSNFWNDVLVPNLAEKFDASPVHSLYEIARLKKYFPNNIKQYSIYLNENIVAGCVIFETKEVAHVQYISTLKNSNLGALDYLVHELLVEIYQGKKYFDFGISNENNGRNINNGLLNWKQSFGAFPVVHDFYEIDISNYSNLNDVLL